ncbi:MAG TPA: nucleoside deaminase [bacterium]|nr:nucleoside deaminase [bacterium]
MDDESLIKEALHEARSAFAEGEVPIGAVVARDGQILGRGHNSKENLCDPTAHAEILALRQAAQFTGSWRLTGSTLYATAEPCLMCLGAALQARVGTIVFGCEEPKFGAVRLLARDSIVKAGNHALIVRGGVLAQECAEILRDFFETRRP